MARWGLANLSKSWGGGEQWTLSAALALRERGHEVTIFAYPGSRLQQQAIQAGLEVWNLKARALSLLNPWKVWRTLRLLRDFQLEAIVLNASHELKFLGLLAFWAKVPHIFFRRGIPQPLQGHFWNRWCLKHLVTRLLVNSQATLEAMRTVFAAELPALAPLVIYNGLDLRGWQRQRPAPSQGMIGVVGRLSYEKGIDRALEVFARMNPAGHGWHLWIVGEGEERTALEALTSQLGLQTHVRFWGFREDVRELLEACDVLFLPSRWEGFGFVLLEAMSLEVPTVAFAISAACEIIVDGQTGFLIPEGDFEQAAQKLQLLLENPGLRQKMGQAARKRVEHTFSLNQMAQKLEAALQSPKHLFHQ